MVCFLRLIVLAVSVFLSISVYAVEFGGTLEWDHVPEYEDGSSAGADITGWLMVTSQKSNGAIINQQNLADPGGVLRTWTWAPYDVQYNTDYEIRLKALHTEPARNSPLSDHVGARIDSLDLLLTPTTLLLELNCPIESTCVIVNPDPPADPLVGDVLNLDFNEGTGVNAVDNSGAGNNGLLTGGATFNVDTFSGNGFSVRIDGSTGSVELPVIDLAGDQLTIAARFKVEGWPGEGDPRFISKATGMSNVQHFYMLGVLTTETQHRLRARLRSGGITTTLVATAGDVFVGTWHHAAVTYDGANVQLYLDGVEVGAVAMTGDLDVDAVVPTAVGSQPPDAGGQNLLGLVDEVKMFSTALTPVEIVTLTQ